MIPGHDYFAIADAFRRRYDRLVSCRVATFAAMVLVGAVGLACIALEFRAAATALGVVGIVCFVAYIGFASASDRLGDRMARERRKAWEKIAEDARNK